MSVGKRIKEVRKNLGMSQVEFAKAIGVSKQTLYKYENDLITNIPSDKIELAAEIGGVTPGYLMGWPEEPKKKLVITLPRKPFMDALDKAMEERIEHLVKSHDFDALNMLDKFYSLMEEDQKEIMEFIDYKLSKYNRKED